MKEDNLKYYKGDN